MYYRLHRRWQDILTSVTDKIFSKRNSNIEVKVTVISRNETAYKNKS